MQAFDDALLAMLLEFPWAEENLARDRLLCSTLLETIPGWAGHTMTSPPGREAFRRELRRGLESARTAKGWRLPKIEERLVDEPVGDERILRSVFKGKDDQILIRAAAAVLRERWRDVRWCASPGCGRPFVRKGKLRYCSPAHAQRTHYETWKKNRQMEKRKGKRRKESAK